MRKTTSNNVVLPRLKRLDIPLNLGITFVPQEEDACEYEKNLHHRVKVSIRDAVGENQTTKHGSWIVSVIDMDVPPS